MTLVSFAKTIELIKKRPILESTNSIVLVLWKMSHVVNILFP